MKPSMNQQEMNNDTSIQLEVEQNLPPLFLIEETPTHYLVAIDIPSLPAEEVRIREQKKELFVEGIPYSSFLQKKTYFQFHSKSRSCRTLYKDGVLWLIMPKYYIHEKTEGCTLGAVS